MSRDYNIEIRPKFYIPFIIFGLSLAVFFTVHDSNKIKQLHNDFKKIENYESVYGKIENLYTEKGACFITLNTEQKIFIPTSKNYLTKNLYLDNSLSIGDSLFKHKDSDTIFLYKDNEIEYFVIGKFINNAP